MKIGFRVFTIEDKQPTFRNLPVPFYFATCQHRNCDGEDEEGNGEDEQIEESASGSQQSSDDPDSCDP